MTEVSQNLPIIIAPAPFGPTKHTRAKGIPLAPLPCQITSGRFSHKPDAYPVPSTRNIHNDFKAAAISKHHAR